MGEKSKGNEEPGRIVNRRIGATKVLSCQK